MNCSQESCEETSKSNRAEAEFTLSLIQFIQKRISGEQSLVSLKNKIGIISPYKSQVRTLKDFILPWLRNNGARNQDIEINTVDAYQGREKDIIIMNCVRSNKSAGLKGSLGFLVDERRMNVAITRAKHFLFVIGNSRTLCKNSVWKDFIDHCQKTDRNFYMISEDRYDEKVFRDLFSGKSEDQEMREEKTG